MDPSAKGRFHRGFLPCVAKRSRCGCGGGNLPAGSFGSLASDSSRQRQPAMKAIIFSLVIAIALAGMVRDAGGFFPPAAAPDDKRTCTLTVLWDPADPGSVALRGITPACSPSQDIAMRYVMLYRTMSGAACAATPK